MCHVFFIIDPNDKYKFILISNRDELYNRETETLHLWDNKIIIGGKDCKCGGIQIGMNINGKISVLTNLVGIVTENMNESRGLLVKEYLNNEYDPIYYMNLIIKDKYKPYNLTCGNVKNDKVETYYSNTFNDEIMQINTNIIYGLGNMDIFDDNDNIEYIKKELEMCKIIKHKKTLSSMLFNILNDSHIFRSYKDKEYGTRTQCIVLIDNNNKVTFIERNLKLPSLIERSLHMSENMSFRMTKVINNDNEWIETYCKYTII
ncbi:transport and golgi organization protein 2 [Fadolivirus algeromassiliense]|jgi:uncharacterized protein with NRDE domain|uniref:Transport and golgi organization protein 2 n=1 Tax=Fadolivirus FV1/VV64 TaxID=3070911 RepID=A0A7D3UQA9_9VIRU|nr:transport and golgi organization protein 2 [Fadolivirus algeromassiliense]QKF93633.1 transport and golgi organization protein 2 [Fadolivirus FV1/VV64]